MVVREAAMVGDDLLLPSGEDAVWDGRFAVRHDSEHSALTVRALGSNGLAQLPRTNCGLRAWGNAAARSVPAFWHLESLVAAPHMDYYAEPAMKHRFKALLCAAKPLAASPFFGFNTTSAYPIQE